MNVKQPSLRCQLVLNLSSTTRAEVRAYTWPCSQLLPTHPPPTSGTTELSPPKRAKAMLGVSIPNLHSCDRELVSSFTRDQRDGTREREKGEKREYKLVSRAVTSVLGGVQRAALSYPSTRGVLLLKPDPWPDSPWPKWRSVTQLLTTVSCECHGVNSTSLLSPSLPLSPFLSIKHPHPNLWLSSHYQVTGLEVMLENFVTISCTNIGFESQQFSEIICRTIYRHREYEDCAR